MNLRDLLAGIPLRGARLNLEMEINSISTDLNRLNPDTLFVDVSGTEARQALERGAAAVVSEQELPGGITVEQPWLTLALLGANWHCHPGRRMVLLAAAGSGDTALAAHLLRVMLERMPRIRVGMIAPDTVWINGVELPEGLRVPGGLCLQGLLRRMADEGCTHVILQLDEGALERQETAGLRMSLSAFTGPAGDRTEMARLMSCSDTVILNLDERAWEDSGDLVPGRVFTYSENKARADVTARNLRLFPGHMEFEAVTVGQIQRIHLPMTGGFGVYHGLYVLACGLCLGLKLKSMAQVLRSAGGPEGRLEILPVPAAYTVVLDRAGTPQELERLLTCARAFTAGQLICLLDCGTQEKSGLRPVLGGVAEQLADQLILTCGTDDEQDRAACIREVLSGTGSWQRPCIVEPDRQRAICGALSRAGAGDVIVLAGREEKRPDRAGEERHPDERKIVFDYIQQHHFRRQTGTWAGV